MTELEESFVFFEKWSSLHIMLQDSSDGVIGFHLPYRYYLHRCPECIFVKDENKKASRIQPREHPCIKFDHKEFQTIAWNFRNGALKLCASGLMEWVMPLFTDTHVLVGTLEAGIRLPPEKIPDDIPVYGVPLKELSIRFPHVKRSDAEEIKYVMEGLRQLAARLILWYQETKKNTFSGVPPDSNLAKVYLHVRRNFASKIQISSLAEKLHLSVSRTSHLVRELTGKSYKELILEQRLNLARHSLKYTGTPVKVIAERCGFRDPAEFFRIFRKTTGFTPRRYRLCNTPGKQEIPEPQP